MVAVELTHFYYRALKSTFLIKRNSKIFALVIIRLGRIFLHCNLLLSLLRVECTSVDYLRSTNYLCFKSSTPLNLFN